MTPRYRRRDAHTIEARRINADDWDSVDHIARWCRGTLLSRDDFLAFHDNAVIYLNGTYAEDGDWVVANGLGDHFIVTDAQFQAYYEPVNTHD